MHSFEKNPIEIRFLEGDIHQYSLAMFLVIDRKLNGYCISPSRKRISIGFSFQNYVTNANEQLCRISFSNPC
jgi:hypothetical protein